MDDSFSKYLTYFFDWDNPVYYAIIFIILIVVIIQVFFSKIYFPKKKLHKKELELTQAKTMAMFAELDPNPLFRIDKDFNILHYNTSALSVVNISKDELKDAFSNLKDFNLQEIILNNATFSFERFIEEKYYLIIVKGIKELDNAHIYLTDLTVRKSYEQKLIDSENKLREISFYLQDNLEEEKQRIGLELHDSIGQNLMLIKMKLNSALEKNSFNKDFDDISNTINLTIDEIKNIIYNLKPRILEDIGLHAAIETMINHLNKFSKIKGSFNIEGKPFRFGNKKELYLFRIIQECTNNILKHSNATEYHIQMFYEPELLKIVTSDDGVGFDPMIIESSRYKGNGLFNINERVNNLKGKMDIESSPEEGSVIYVEIPLRNN
ncbi:MAG: sensor histidine kinase [Syntrophothermus sp.]